MMILVLAFVGSAFAVDNSTSVDVTLNSSIDAGYTPDNTIMYNFDRFGDWVSLNFAKLQGQEKYDSVEEKIIQERLEELKLVREETREEFQTKIETQIQDRKERRELKLEELKKQIEERKQELNLNNQTSVVNDEVISEIEQEMNKLQEKLQNDDDNLRKNLKEVSEQRLKEIEKLQEKMKDKEFQSRVLNNQVGDFEDENKELIEKYSSLLEDFDGNTFKITTDKRELYGEVKNGSVEFYPELDKVDYNIQVKNEAEVKEMIRLGETDIEKFNENVDAPIKLKTKLAYSIATMENRE